MATDGDKITELLRKSGVSVTATRKAIFETLKISDRPLKKGEIARLTPEVDRASVYRTLELFSKLGVTVTTIRGWTPLTELAEPFKPHHHHIICDKCGRVVEIGNDKLEILLNSVAASNDFELVSHVVELRGLCTKCKD